MCDCDDVDTWMVDTLRLVLIEDIGRDEASVQVLIKKHMLLRSDIKDYNTVVAGLHAQVSWTVSRC